MAYVPVLAGQTLTADLLNTRIVEETMAWTPLDQLGTYATNFFAGSPAPRMRKVVVNGTEQWELEGRISCSAFAAAQVITVFTFNVGHRVSSERGFSCYGAGTIHYPVRVGFNTNGTLVASVPSAVGTSTTGFWLDEVTITNPV